MNSEEMARTLKPEEVLAVKEDLFELYKKELFAGQLYLGQTRKLEGVITTILNDLIDQEQRHASILRTMLSRAGVETKDNYEKIPQSKINEPLVKAVSYDISLEDEAMHAYAETIKKAKSEKVKLILAEIRNDEIRHLAMLKEYERENE